jgi:RNA-directed DNA polymerase
MSASLTVYETQTGSSIDWGKAKRQVYRLQVRITKAIKAKRYGKAKALSWLLTHSHTAKLLAIKKVTESTGGKTARVDGVYWIKHHRKYQAVKELNHLKQFMSNTYKAKVL